MTQSGRLDILCWKKCKHGVVPTCFKRAAFILLHSWTGKHRNPLGPETSERDLPAPTSLTWNQHSTVEQCQTYMAVSQNRASCWFSGKTIQKGYQQKKTDPHGSYQEPCCKLITFLGGLWRGPIGSDSCRRPLPAPSPPPVALLQHQSAPAPPMVARSRATARVNYCGWTKSVSHHPRNPPIMIPL